MDNAKDVGSDTSETVPVAISGNSSSVFGRSFNILSQWKDVMEAEEEVRELELQLKQTCGAFKHSESENARLKNELLFTKEKLKQSGKRHDLDNDLNVKKLQEQVTEAEERYSLQLKNLQETLQSQESNQQELTVELESSSKRLHEVEELHKESGSLAESETKRVLVFEKLLELAKASAEEVEAHMVILQEEVTGLYEKMAENEGVEEVLKSTTSELSDVQRELDASKSQIKRLEKKCEDAEEESEKHSQKVSELEAEIESFHLKVADLDELTEKFKSIESDLSAAGLRESEVVEKLKYAEEQLDEFMRLMENATTRRSEFAKEHETLKRNSDLKVQEVNANYTIRDIEANSLFVISKTLEDQLKINQEELDQVLVKLASSESANEDLKRTISEARDREAQALLKLSSLESLVEEVQSKSGHYVKESEDLAEVNMELSQELASYESKRNVLEAKLSAALSETDEAVELLRSSKQETEDLTQQFTSQGQKLQTQISLVAEEKNLLNEASEIAKVEFQTAIIQLEGQVTEHISNELALKDAIKILKAEIAENTELRKSLEELEQQLTAADSRAKGEKETQSKEVLEKDVALKMSREENEDKSKSLLIVEARVKGLEKKLQLANTNSKEKEVVARASESQVKEDISALESMLLLTKEDLHGKVYELDEIKLKLNKEENEKELVRAEKEVFENKLQLSDDNFSKTNSLLSKSLANSIELERKLRSLEELNLESGHAVKIATHKNIELEDIVRASIDDTEQAKEQVRELVSELTQSTVRNSELELELKGMAEKFDEHEGRADGTRQRSLELEDLVQISHCKVEASGKRESELIMLLEAEKYRTQELEEEIRTLEKKCGDGEEESEKQSQKVYELKAEIELFRLKVADLELALQTTNADLKEKLENIASELGAAGLRESEVVEKLKYAEEQLDEFIRLMEHATTRRSEFAKEHETVKRDSDQKVKEAIANYTSRDIEANSLSEKSKTLEDQLKIHQEELDQVLVKLASSESANEELTRTMSENELLAKTNIQLKHKINELKDLLTSETAEKEATIQTVTSHINTITDLSDQHSKASESLLKSEVRISEVEKQLQEAIMKLSLRDSEANDVLDKLNAFEVQISAYEEKEHEASVVVENRSYEFKAKLLAALAEKDEVVELLHSSKQEIEDLAQKFTSEGQKLQTQIYSVAEEKNLANEASEIAKGEFQTAIIQLEGQVLEHVSNELALKDAIKILKAEIAENAGLRKSLEELEHQLTVAEEMVKYEKETQSKEVLEKDTALKTFLDDCKAKNKSHKRDSDLKVQEANANYTSRDIEAKSLFVKSKTLEDQLKIQQEEFDQVLVKLASSESANEDLTRTISEALLKLSSLESLVEEVQSQSGHNVKESEDLAEVNMGLSQELASYESERNVLEAKLFAALAETDEVVEMLHSSKQEIEDLTQKFTSEGHKLKTQIPSAAKETNLVNEASEIAKAEFQTAIIQLEGQVTEHISNELALKDAINILKAEIVENAGLRKSLEELEQQLTVADSRAKDEKEAESSEKDVALKTSLEDIEAKSKSLSLLEAQVKVLEQKLQLADANSKEKEIVKSPIEVTSRDFGSISSPTKRKGKKMVEVNSQGLSSTDPHTTTHPSLATSFKFIMGVAIVSTIIGIVLGKRY